MDPFLIIEKYYLRGTQLYDILVEHSRAVAGLSVDIARRHPEMNASEEFLYEAAMLHDIGIFMTNAPGIECPGSQPYICHGVLGSELLVRENLPRHALVCERHTGAGLSIEEIISQKLPVPHRDMMPQSIEEQIICYADNFFSKSGALSVPKPVERIRKSLMKHGEEQVKRFDLWHSQWGLPDR